MDRGAQAGFLAELVKSVNSPCYLLDVSFDDGAVRMTDAWRAVTFNSNTYTAQGHFMTFNGLTESAELQVPNLSITISSVDRAWVSIALTKAYINRKLVLYKAFLDYTQGLISSPIIIFEGSLDGMSVSDSPDGKCSVQVTATSQWGDFERRPGRHTNPQEQQVIFPGDKFFDYCAQLNKEIRWGAV